MREMTIDWLHWWPRDKIAMAWSSTYAPLATLSAAEAAASPVNRVIDRHSHNRPRWLSDGRRIITPLRRTWRRIRLLSAYTSSKRRPHGRPDVAANHCWTAKSATDSRLSSLTLTTLLYFWSTWRTFYPSLITHSGTYCTYHHPRPMHNYLQ